MSSVGQSDAVIVGLGFAGATAAYALAKAGMRVLALEAGPYRTDDEYRLDEITKSVFQRPDWDRSSTRSSRPGGQPKGNRRDQPRIHWGK